MIREAATARIRSQGRSWSRDAACPHRRGEPRICEASLHLFLRHVLGPRLNTHTPPAATAYRCTARASSTDKPAGTPLRPWIPAFTHGDLQVAHVFVDGDEVTGIIDWSEAARGDPLYDLATLTLGHEKHFGDVVAGYGSDVDLDVICAWWSLRLRGARWLVEHGFDPTSPGCEVDVLRTQAMRG
ncbi:phosphotransferase [Nocardia salmonicida]